MTLPSLNPEFPPENKEVFIDKNEVVNILKKFISDYPTDPIPFNIVEGALKQVAGYDILKSINEHPVFKKLEQTISKAKIISSS